MQIINKLFFFSFLKIPHFAKIQFRYFDLRICRRDEDNLFYFVHGLYCEEINEPLIQIRQFLDSHPSEFVVLDCQHFYNFNDSDFTVLADQLIQIFQNICYGQEHGNLADLTLDNAAAQQTQVVIIYRSSRTIPVLFWPSDYWPNPWPNQIKVSKLQEYLDSSLNNRSPDHGFVTQCVLTPPANYIVPR